MLYAVDDMYVYAMVGVNLGVCIQAWSCVCLFMCVNVYYVYACNEDDAVNATHFQIELQ